MAYRNIGVSGVKYNVRKDLGVLSKEQLKEVDDVLNAVPSAHAQMENDGRNRQQETVDRHQRHVPCPQIVVRTKTGHNLSQTL